MLPEMSEVTAPGLPMGELRAAIGVGGGVPPAMVEILYCWARAAQLPSKKEEMIPRGSLIWYSCPGLYHILCGMSFRLCTGSCEGGTVSAADSRRGLVTAFGLAAPVRYTGRRRSRTAPRDALVASAA